MSTAVATKTHYTPEDLLAMLSPGYFPAKLASGPFRGRLNR